ncbi:MAG: alpha/beta hydrolase [Homoserinimonas sp.]|nr:alpha/beta hydrolase [Homoserinimonas sp.]
MKSTRRAAAVSGSLIAALLLSGCTMFAPSPASTPTGENVSEDLQPFYDQVLEWKACDDGFQCATAEAPMDWKNPQRESIQIALIRAVATGDRLGSLLLNPGGPGASGVAFVRDSVAYATSEKLRSSFDVVGFDPRGVNESSAVDCYEDPDELTAFLYDLSPEVVGSEAWIDDMEQAAAEFGQACLEHTGDMLGYVDTVSAARDLDLLRAVLGDAKLNYLGYSYGTLLGATYADLYPTKTGKLVLDGAVDPATTDFEVSATQAQGFEGALRSYLESCLSGTECPFRGSVDEAMLDIRALFDNLDASPLLATDGRELGSSAMFRALILPLYSQTTWEYLTQLLTDVMRGNADLAFQLADSYYGRNPDGTFNDNSTQGFVAINCLDYESTSTRESLHAEAAELARLAPVLGPQMSYGGTSCDEWPFPPTRDRVKITASGSGPIVVVGTTNDPATPYAWAVSLADQLENGYLVTYEGEGHTAYNKSNACVNDAVDNYFINDLVPKSDPRC